MDLGVRLLGAEEASVEEERQKVKEDLQNGNLAKQLERCAPRKTHRGIKITARTF